MHGSVHFPRQRVNADKATGCKCFWTWGSETAKGYSPGWVSGLCILTACRFLILHSIAPLLPLGWPTVLASLGLRRVPQGMGLSASKSGKAWTNQDKLATTLRRPLAKFPHSTPSPCRILIIPLPICTPLWSGRHHPDDCLQVWSLWQAHGSCPVNRQI